MSSATAETGDASRKDDGKAPFWLIPWEALWALAVLYGKGAAKYGPNQWRDHPMDYSRTFSALQRHAWAWWGKEEYDPIDGQHHLIAVAWNAFSLYTHQVVLKLTKQDNRQFSGPVPQTFITRTEMYVPAAIPVVPKHPTEDKGLDGYHRGLLRREADREVEARRDMLPESARAPMTADEVNNILDAHSGLGALKETR